MLRSPLTPQDALANDSLPAHRDERRFGSSDSAAEGFEKLFCKSHKLPLTVYWRGHILPPHATDMTSQSRVARQGSRFSRLLLMSSTLLPNLSAASNTETNRGLAPRG
jgi:hypothetical protein